MKDPVFISELADESKGVEIDEAFSGDTRRQRQSAIEYAQKDILAC
jgi:hypothetical protein